MCRGKFKGSYVDVGDRGGLIDDKFKGYVPLSGNFYAYASDETMNELSKCRYVAIGMVCNFYCHGEASFDMFSFKFSLLNDSTGVKSEMILLHPILLSQG